jgi:hypothetical protein
MSRGLFLFHAAALSFHELGRSQILPRPLCAAALAIQSLQSVMATPYRRGRALPSARANPVRERPSGSRASSPRP